MVGNVKFARKTKKKKCGEKCFPGEAWQESLAVLLLHGPARRITLGNGDVLILQAMGVSCEGDINISFESTPLVSPRGAIRHGVACSEM